MTMNSTSPAASPARRNKKSRPKRWLPWLGAALLAGLIVLGFLPQPIPVETARVTVGTLRATVNEEGKTRIKQRYVVSAPVSGHLRRIAFKPGAEVKAGETVVAVIDPLSPALLDARNRALDEARREVAVANLEKAREAHRFAANELKRFQKLFDEKALSPQELEPAQWRETSTTKDQSAAESALRQAEAELTEFALVTDGTTNTLRAPVEVKAPATGRVLRVFEESTRVLVAGTPLLEVGDPRNIEVVIEVLSRDGAAIAPGMKVLVEQWGGGEALAARVRLVEPAAFMKVSALGVEEQRVNVVADLDTTFDQRKNLGDNFRVEARIVAWESDKVLKVPAGALFRSGKSWGAFVSDAGHAHLRKVEVGRASATEMQVLSGLVDGETVLLYPGDRLQEGVRIKPIQVSP